MSDEKLKQACSILYALTVKILKVPDLPSHKEMLDQIRKLSDQTVEKNRELLIVAAEMAEKDPDRASEIYALADLANTAVLNAVNMVSATARMRSVQEALNSIDKETIN